MILCCGEALIDMLPRTADTGEEAFTPACGGAIFNTAIALGRLGAPVSMLTGLSTDMFGKQLLEELHASNVDTAHTISSHRPSTLAFVELKEGQANYSFFDENSAGRMLRVHDMPALSSGITALYFGGISLACEPAADAYVALAKAESDNRTVMLDPNIRTSFITDEARYRERLKTMLQLADIVKVSDEDLEWIIPGDKTLTEKVEALLDQGSSLVIVTKGADGVIGFLHSGVRIDVPALEVDVIDTVGAGDTFNAGVLAELSDVGALERRKLKSLSPETIERALAFGTKVAGITVSRAGANPPWAQEL